MGSPRANLIEYPPPPTAHPAPRPPPPSQGRLTGNVLDHLPEAHHAWVRRKLRGAWAKADADDARRDLEALARALQRKHPGATASLREGLEETLTVTKLQITGSLLKTVFSTYLEPAVAVGL